MIPSKMKGFLFLLLTCGVLAVVVAVFVSDLVSERGGHDFAPRQEAFVFASGSLSREQYINYLLRTEKHDDPELWRRIAAVKNLKDWPE